MIRIAIILFPDIQMKGMDGLETARKLRADRFRGFLIFILFSHGFNTPMLASF